MPSSPQMPRRAAGPTTAKPTASGHASRQKIRLFLGFLIVSSLVLTVGVIAFLQARNHLRQTVENELTTITEQKRQQVAQMLSALRTDSALFAEGQSPLAEKLERWIQQPEATPSTESSLRRHLAEIADAHAYSSIAIFDEEGRVRLTTGTVDAAVLADQVRSVIATERPLFVDLHRVGDGTIQFGLLAPVRPEGRRPRAAVLFFCDANRVLYPLVQRWPIPTGTAESYLVRREQQEAVLLSPFRDHPGAELSFSRPLGDPELPGAAAARGHHGVFRGRDYRGQPVLAYTAPVADAPWFLVAKIDMSEADAGIRKLAWMTGLAMLLTLGALYLIGLGLWRRDRQAREQSAQLVRREVEARYRLLFEKAPLGIALIGSLNGRIHEVNPRYARIVGRTSDELTTMDWMQITHPDDIQEDLVNMARLNAGEISEFEMQKRYLRPDGSVVWVDMLITPLGIRIAGGPSHACIVEDITESKRADAAIRQRTLELDQFFRLSIDMLCIVDTKGRFLRVNPAWESALGYSAAELENRTFIDLVHPDDQPSTLGQLADHLRGGEVLDFRNRYRTRQGGYRWLEWRSAPKDGELIFAVARDITARMAAEDALRTSREQFASAFREASIGMALVAPDGRWLNVNPALCGLIGYSEDELLAGSFQEVTHPDDLDADLALIRQMLSGEITTYRLEKRYLHKSGYPIWILLSVSLLRDQNGAPVHFIKQIVDIDARKRAEDAQSFLLRSGLPGSDEDFFLSLARYLAVNLAMEYVCIDRLEGEGLFAQTVAVYHDGTFDDNVRYALKDTPCGAVLDESVCCYERHVRQHFPRDEALEDLRAESYVGTVLWDSRGRPIGLIAVIGRQPLTDRQRGTELLRLVAPRAGWELERREADTRLRASERRFHDVAQVSADWIWEVDHEARYTFVSPGITGVLGYAPDDLLGRTPFDFMTTEEANRVRDEFRLIMERGGPFRDLPNTVVHKDGSSRHLLTSGMPFVDESGTLLGYRGVDRDVTVQHQAEAEIRRYRVELEQRVAERTTELQRVNNKLRETVFALESVGTAIYEVDVATGQLTYSNHFAAHLLGYSRDEMRELRVWDFDVELGTEENYHRYAAAALENGFLRFETTHRHQDGHIIPVEMSVYAQPRPDGPPTLFTGFGVDISERKQAERQLMESEERFRAIADSAPVLIWMSGLDRECTFFNQPWLEFTGRTLAEESGNGWAEGVHSDDYQRCLDVYVKSFDAKRPFEMEYRLRRHDGEYRWILDNGRPRHDQEGNFLGYIGSCIDITERVQLQRQLEDANRQLTLSDQRLSAMFAMSQSATQLTEEQLLQQGVDEAVRLTQSEIGYLHFVNEDEESLRLVTWSTSTLMRCTAVFDEHYPVSQAGIWADTVRYKRPVIHNDYQGLESRHGYPEGHVHLIRHLGVPVVEHGKVVLLLGVGNKSCDYNESDQKELQLIGNDVWRIFSRRRAEILLGKAKEAAESAMRIKSEFLANMSHEIRTPLNGVLGLAQIGFRDQEMPTKARDNFRQILSSGKVLLNVIDDILDFSKIEAGKLLIETLSFDPAKTLRDVAENVRSRANAKGLQFNVDSAPTLPAACLGDAIRVAQILLNLLTNAIKFTESGSVNLAADWDRGYLVFRVADTGVGMSSEHLGRLFAPFEQADSSTTRKFGGTGLGLAITKQLVDLMGGEIRVESQVGKGSMFEVRLPCPETPAENQPGTDDSLQGASGLRLYRLRLLVAEDDPINRVVIEDMLRAEGAVVTLVENGRIATETLANDPLAWDAVLLDIQMPELDGFEAARRIRKLNPDIPLIGQTAHALSEEHAKCGEAGMIDVVTKPIDQEELVATVLRHVRPAPSSVPTLVALSGSDDSQEKTDNPHSLVNWAELETRYRGKEAFVDRLISLSIDNYGPLPQTLRTAAAKSNLATIARTAHTLKGSLGNLMATEPADLADRTQRAARAGDTVTTRLAVELAATVERLVAELTQQQKGRVQSED